MHLIKTIKKERILIVAFIFFFYLTRLPMLGRDAINPDGVNWHYRSEQFMTGIKNGQFSKTYQHYHPGVTLMWITGPTVEILRQLYPETRVYSHLNFLTMHTIVKVVLVHTQLILSLVILYFLQKVLSIRNQQKGFLKALATVSLFSFEPFFVGNSRLLHMDILLTLFLFLGLLIVYFALHSKNRLHFALGGAILGLAVLTKSVGIGGIIFSIVYVVAFLLAQKRTKEIPKTLLALTIPFLATVIVFFPALWVEPQAVLSDIVNEAQRVGIRKGHGQIFFGEYTRDPGYLFYVFVLLIKTSPFTIFGTLFGLFSLRLSKVKEYLKSPVLFLFVFYLGYFVVMLFPSKKLDRYMLVLFPLMGMLAVYGFQNFYKYISSAYLRRAYISLIAVFVITFIFGPLVRVFPYYFTYTSPLFGSTEDANSIIAQKPFGIGIPALKDHIFEKYGDYPTLGFIDTKPMKSIYIGSKIYDVRETDASKVDLLVLASDEDFPPRVIASDLEFVEDSYLEINGIKYWRIYVKTGNLRK